MGYNFKGHIWGMSMSFPKRLKSIIKEENLTQKEFGDLVGIQLKMVQRYLSGTSEPSGGALMKISTHNRFRKYTIWLLTGNVEPNSGQVCPAFSTQEKCGLIAGENDIQQEG